MATQRLRDAVLRASAAASALFIERRSTDLTVAEIAASIGITERTYYRYFPTKQEVIRPLFDWGHETIVEAIATRTDLSVRASLEVGFASAVGGPLSGRTSQLVPLVLGDSAFRAIYLQAFHDREVSLRPVLAARLGIAEDSARASIAAATVVTMMRLSLEFMVETGASPGETFSAALDEVERGPYRDGA